jgi:glycerophosphoryl diester phosphodiesterase
MAAKAWLCGAAQPLVIAHRGASAAVLENTMAAFERARADGADGIELDVRLTVDGALVVFHDADLRRLAGRAMRIDRLDQRAVSEIRLAGDLPIPILDQVLGDLPDLLVNVELKTTGPGAARRAAASVASTLYRTGAADRVVVSSFDPLAVAACRVVMPHVKTGMLFHGRQPRPLRDLWLAPVIRPFAVHPERLRVDAGRVEDWRRGGYAINVWTVDGVDEVRRLAALGVDALITNDPAATRAILEAR